MQFIRKFFEKSKTQSAPVPSAPAKPRRNAQLEKEMLLAAETFNANRQVFLDTMGSFLDAIEEARAGNHENGQVQIRFPDNGKALEMKMMIQQNAFSKIIAEREGLRINGNYAGPLTLSPSHNAKPGSIGESMKSMVTSLSDLPNHPFFSVLAANLDYADRKGAKKTSFGPESLAGADAILNTLMSERARGVQWGHEGSFTHALSDAMKDRGAHIMDVNFTKVNWEDPTKRRLEVSFHAERRYIPTLS